MHTRQPSFSISFLSTEIRGSQAMNDSDQNCPPATASVTVVAASSSSSSPSPSKEMMLHQNQPANSAQSPLLTAAQPSSTKRRSADLTASEISGLWKGERKFFISRLFVRFDGSIAHHLVLLANHLSRTPPSLSRHMAHILHQTYMQL